MLLYDLSGGRRQRGGDGPPAPGSAGQIRGADDDLGATVHHAPEEPVSGLGAGCREDFGYLLL